VGNQANNPEPQCLASAKERFPKYFDISDMVISQVVDWLHNSGVRPQRTAVDFVKTGSFVRAANIYRSINLLLETDHWEDAAILSRSLFELLLNLDEVIRDEGSAEEQAKKYLRFNKLQKYLRTRSLVEYDIETGRGRKEQERKLAELDALCRSLFREFLTKKRAGWVTSWHRKPVAQLCRDSSNPGREAQYRTIYSLYCSLSHSTPYAAMTTFTEVAEDEQVGEWIRNREKSEEEHLALVMSLSTTWLLELVLHVSSIIPTFDVSWCIEVLELLYQCNGVEPPPLSPEVAAELKRRRGRNAEAT
jgi:uncharacterized protein DUF5677